MNNDVIKYQVISILDLQKLEKKNQVGEAKKNSDYGSDVLCTYSI